jgi:hypothetical protein
MKKPPIISTAISAVLVSALLSGCIEDGTTTGSPAKGVAVKFSTSISKTRAYGNMWEPDDQIGVWMVPAGSTDWSDPETAPIGSNMLYGHSSKTDDANVVFTGIGDENTLVWPEEGNVDFVAYYPYLAQGIDGSIYPIDLSNQDPQNEIDLMYSDNAADLNISSGNPELSFSHKLTKLVFNITDAGGTSLDDMTATFEGLPATAEFDLSTGEIVEGSEGNPEDFDAALVSTFNNDEDENAVNETAIVEAIVLPGSELDYTLTFDLSNGEKAVFTPREIPVTYEAGKRYIYNISLKQGPTNIEFVEAEGDLESIEDWTSEEDETPYELPKDDEDEDKDEDEENPFAGEQGAPWESKTMSDTSDRYSLASWGTAQISGSEYVVTSNGGVTIAMNTFEGGVAFITINMRSNLGGKGEITSVKVDGTSFTCSDGDSPLESVPISGIGNGRTYIFESPDGNLFSGDIEIVVTGITGSIVIKDFSVN